MRKRKPLERKQVANELAPALRRDDRMTALAPVEPKDGPTPGKPV
ncbi:hypothetical protein [Sphingomicrobium marinum]|nr:hypothetical protein [Sphingomicrobium marinum]